ncbi:MAG: 1-deoxy-D-xylulose-5-phosphate reductoisomerase, partial [Clostridia bacterium]|nr:1-deoxy-D-xylulose-5-phosphate reductoisomerase [Clostridia bacterium]
VVLNGANEAAVALFLDGRIGFNDIPRAVEAAMRAVSAPAPRTYEDIALLDREARVKVKEFTHQ